MHTNTRSIHLSNFHGREKHVEFYLIQKRVTLANKLLSSIHSSEKPS